jgi:hypothetical protein
MKATKKTSRITTTFCAFIVFSLSVNCFAQIPEAQKVDLIKRDVIDFLVDRNELEKGKKIEEYDQRIHISGLLDEKPLGSNSNLIGLYRIKIFTSHTKQYLLINNKSVFRILDIDNFAESIQIIVYFLKEQKYTDAQTADCVESIVDLYRINQDRNSAKLGDK